MGTVKRVLGGRATPMLLLVCGVLLAPATAHAAFPGENGRIAFETNFDDEIASATPKGSDVRVDAHGDQPAFAPDGRSIAFVRYREDPNYTSEIFAAAPGEGPRRLTHNKWWEYDPAFAPDAGKIVFAADRLSPNTGGCFPGDYECFPVPDSDPGYGIWIMDLAGRNARNLTEPASTDVTNRYSDYGPVFSPDGNAIAFIRDGDIWSMRPDGSSQRRLTDTPLDESSIDYSPDGRRIVFYRGGSPTGADSAIVTIRASGGGDRVLVDDDLATDPVYSPDGRRVLFSREGTLVTVRARHGGGARRIPLPRRREGDNSPVSYWGPIWGASPATCAGRTATIVSQGSEAASGTRGRDVIVASRASDVVRGRAGGDLICAGAGPDTLAGGPGRDRLLGQRGTDVLKGGAGRDACRGGRGRDRERSC